MFYEVFTRILRKYRSDGLVALLSALVYFGTRETIAVLLTRLFGTPKQRIGMYNGVAVRNVHLLHDTDEFEHETQLMQSIRDFLSTGDEVVLIGAGTGASTVCAARQVGPEGTVTAFEAAENAVSKCRETIRLNRVNTIAECRHAVVETPIYLLGSANRAEQLSATDLPDCDALVMDCEGAEKAILEGLSDLPDVIIVETHVQFDSSSEQIREILSDRFTEVNALARNANIDVLTFERAGGQ